MKRGVFVAVGVGALGCACLVFFLAPRRRKSCQPPRKSALEQLIGNTPLIRINSLSEETGCEILAKVEFVNPGGSVKDRVALQIVQDAELSGDLAPGGTIFEGTSGSTGISLAMVARSKGYHCHIFMPDDQAKEKSDILERLGAQVTRVRPVSIVDPQQYCNLAQTHARQTPGGFFADQFETLSNLKAHYTSTAPEIWKQTNGKIDVFVSGAGTGGTIAGVSIYLKQQNPNIRVCLVDPVGSSLYNRVNKGVLFAPEEKEGTKGRFQVDSIVEGVGLNRLTTNFNHAVVDSAFRATDQEMVAMAQYLLAKEGLFVGSSSAMNCVGAVKAAREAGRGATVVTVLCDHGQRHVSRFHNPDYLRSKQLTPTPTSNLSFVM